MRRIKANVSKKIAVVVLAAIATFSLMGCTAEKAVTTTETHTDADGNTTGSTTTTTTTNKDGEVTEETTETAIDLVTYEFETFDNLKIVLDESNIIAQEPSEDPEYSDLVSESARGNIIAPGRDYVYLEDDDYYYVADLSRSLITVADKSKVKAEVVETASIAGTYSHTYTEEMEGSEMEFTETVVLYDDNTCEISFQDTISGTWTEDQIILDNGNSYEFHVEDNTLNLNMDGVWISFSK